MVSYTLQSFSTYGTPKFHVLFRPYRFNRSENVFNVYPSWEYLFQWSIYCIPNFFRKMIWVDAAYPETATMCVPVILAEKQPEIWGESPMLGQTNIYVMYVCIYNNTYIYIRIYHKYVCIYIYYIYICIVATATKIEIRDIPLTLKKWYMIISHRSWSKALHQFAELQMFEDLSFQRPRPRVPRGPRGSSSTNVGI
jgi:hypothetical protein